MNILFLTLSRITDIDNRGIYTDLMRKFRNEGHRVYIVSPFERRFKQKTQLMNQNNVSIVKVKTLNIQKTNILEKGIGTLLLEHQFNRATQKYLNNIKFDLILYSTPPITLTSVIQSIKNKTGAKTYLLLKDIFPQNAADIGMLNPRGFLFGFFRRKEKKLYTLSDHIGCMSPANVKYLLTHNQEISPEKVEVNPNSVELLGNYITPTERLETRKEYNIPKNSIVFVYGGNLGKPQGLDFLIEVIKENEQKENVFFLIVGAGTEFEKLNNWFKQHQPQNARLIPGLPKEKYDKLIQACDVGLIFLDKRFTIPNFPSRLLSYLEYRMPVITATDPNTDIGNIAEKAGFGFSALSGDMERMQQIINELIKNKNIIPIMGRKGFEYLKSNFLVDYSYQLINKKINQKTP